MHQAIPGRHTKAFQTHVRRHSGSDCTSADKDRDSKQQGIYRSAYGQRISRIQLPQRFGQVIVKKGLLKMIETENYTGAIEEKSGIPAIISH